jgi:Fur family peroxide stress response transcriptional regulator
MSTKRRGHVRDAGRGAVLLSLRRQGLKATPQRLAIADALLAHGGHPTVTEIFDEVRMSFPTMSLATVYHTLHTFAESGVVDELPFAEGTRYDPNVTPHVNLVCQRCGEITDAHEHRAALMALRNAVSARSDFTVTTQRMDFYGLCSRCRVAQGTR